MYSYVHNSWCLSVSSKAPSNTYLDAVIFIQSKPSRGWQVLAATLAFVRLPLRPLLCGVNSRGAIIAGNHLHTRLRSERRAKHLFPPSVKATRLTDMWWCKHTLLCVAKGRHPFGGMGGGASNYLSRNWKWGEMPAVVSTHISTQETDGRTPSPSRLSFPYTHLHAELKLIYALVQWTLKSLLVLGVWICVCALAGSFLSYVWMSQTDACVAPKKDRQNWQKLSLTLVRPCVTGSTFSLHSLIRSWNVGPHGRKHSKMFLWRERVGG